jgi:hypothetical protein
VAAANDFVGLVYDDGSWAAHKISSISGKAYTMTANLSKAVLQGSSAFLFGVSGDHTGRQFTMKASTVTTLVDNVSGWCTALRNGQPILVHSNNATAAGILTGPSYRYVDVG